MTTYTVNYGDCAWKFAKNNLHKVNPTNKEILAELNRLVTVYNCKDIDEFNKKYFSKAGNVFEIIEEEPVAQNQQENNTVFETTPDTLRTHAHVATRDCTYVASHAMDTVPLHNNDVQLPKKDSLIINLGYYKWINFKEEQDRINNLSSDKERVIEWNKTFNKENKQNYIIIDKKACYAYVYSPDGELIKQYEVGVAKNKSDALLIRSKKNPDKDFKATSAGIYTANYRATGRDAYAKLYNDRVLQLSNDGLKEKGIGTGETGVALHQVPNGNTARTKKLEQPGISDENNRISDGCVNFLPEDFDDCMKYIDGVGTKVYILPEEDNNYMCVKNGRLHLTQKDYSGDVATTSTAMDPVKAIKIMVKDPQINENGRSMAYFLAEQKTDLIKDLKLDNDTYNELAMLALGIAGQETNFGSPMAGVKKLHPYFLKENFPEFVNFVKKLKGTNSFNSRGMTQMKLQSYTDNNVKQLLEKYDITEDSLKDPKKCATATMIVLASIYKNELPALKTQMQELNLSKTDALLYCWNNHKNEIKQGTATPEQNIYVRNTHRYMQDFDIYQYV